MDKTFDAAREEARISEKWDQSGAFKAGAGAKEGAEPFTIMLPPPNVTGSLHVGHAYDHTLQDILTRWRRMQGRDTLWQPGLDHAGIATQMVVERQLAERGEPGRRELGREAFTKKVWDWKAESGGTILSQARRLGDSFDISRNAFTMSGAPGAPEGEDGNFHNAVLQVFVDLYHKGLIYRGKRLVNWDPHFETAISDLEVENIEKDGHMWHFKYPLQDGETYEYIEKDEDGNVTLRETRDYISIATTRPETMLGDGAVAVHPSDERYAPIVGKLCEIPVGPKAHRRLIPIITDEYPDPDFGSGAVKITGAHDFNDYAVAKRNNIPLYNLMDTKAAMRADGLSYDESATLAGRIARGEETRDDVTEINLVPEELRGLDRYEARKAVIDAITEEGLAVTTEDEEGNPIPLVENKKIVQPFGDRSGVVIEPFLTDQWFVDAEELAKKPIEAVRSGEIKVIPEAQEKIFFHWMENIEPWTISRQLWWGHQVPVWYGPAIGEGRSIEADGIDAFDSVDGKVFCAESFDQALSQARAYYGEKVKIFEGANVESDNPRRAQAFPTVGGDPSSRELRHISLKRDPDVLDTWFSSGLWPFGTLGWPENTPELQKYFPNSVLITGWDILFFWVARMMMLSYAVTGEKPFDTVYLHGLVRDGKGQKMSKSKGNVIDPLTVIDEYGADALRFALTSMGRDLKLSNDRFETARNFGTKLWNAARFAQMNEARPTPGFDPASPTATANKWIIGETARTRLALDEALEAFRFNEAANILYTHIWNKLCDWYVELAKPLFQSGDEAVIAETRATMAWALDQCLKMLHPLMPFITEAIWEQTGDRAAMLAQADWPEFGAELVDDAADKEMGWVINLIEQIRSVRAQMRVPAGAKIPLLTLELDAAGQAALDRNRPLIERLARLESITPVESAPKGAVTIAVGGGSVCLPLADVIDVAAEEARLEKSVAKLDKEIKGLSSKLSNEKFLEKAPEEVVQDQRDRLAEVEEEAANLRGALARVKEMA
ncbi:valine--tRNA ligase [Paracoccaceae bacterium GXU_MW_L88]